MAHRFAYRPMGTMLTCNLYGQWPIEVDGEHVDVKLVATGGRILLAERYFAYDGSVTLFGIGALIENDMQASGKCFESYTFELLNDDATVADTYTIKALYCDRFSVNTDIEGILSENFLTTLPFRRVAPDEKLTFSLFARAGELLTLRVAYRWRLKGNPEEVLADRFIIPANAVISESVHQMSIAQDALIEDACRSYGHDASAVEIVSFTVAIGQRSLTCYVDRTLSAANRFLFRNCFNVWESANLPALTTAKTEIERSTAVVNTRTQFYDRRITKSYEVESGPLTSDEAEWIDQLLTSHEVKRLVPNDSDIAEPNIEMPVLITNISCEVNDGDEKPNTVKFTWRYANNRPLVEFSASKGIFTNPFDAVYS